MQHPLTLLVFAIIIYGYLHTRYYQFLPTFPFIYPDSKKESVEVYDMMKYRNRYLVNLFYKTDDSVAYAFSEIVPLTPQQLTSKYIFFTPLVLILKYLINRPRPWQVNQNVNKLLLKSNSGNTSAYPSGHAFQAFILARKLSKEYPHLKTKLFLLADDCAKARIIAGLHYPSDNIFARNIVNALPF